MRTLGIVGLLLLLIFGKYVASWIYVFFMTVLMKAFEFELCGQISAGFTCDVQFLVASTLSCGNTKCHGESHIL